MKCYSIRLWAGKHLAGLVLACILILMITDYLYYNQRVYPGVQVKSFSLGNMTVSEAEESLENLKMTFKGPRGEKISLSLAEMGVKPLVDIITYQAYQQGRDKKWPLTYLERIRLIRGVEVPLLHRVDEEKLTKSVDELKKHLEREPKDASFKIVNHNSKLVPEETGYRLEKELLMQKIISCLSQKEGDLLINVPVEEIPPDITVSGLEQMGITEEMGSYTTYFDATYENRAHNIGLAAEELDQYLLPPGELFSFNRLIGDTGPEDGYREALIIRGGDYTTGYGGGICQVSSTLYNAALLSNLKIVERNNHRFRAHYIKAGRDAAVYYGIYDLKFINNHDHHILINTGVKNGQITIAMVGTPLEEEIEIMTREIEFIDPPQRVEITSDLLWGEEEIIEGIPGGKVETFRIVQPPDNKKIKEKLSLDNYYPYPAVIRRGKKEPEQ